MLSKKVTMIKVLIHTTRQIIEAKINAQAADWLHLTGSPHKSTGPYNAWGSWLQWFPQATIKCQKCGITLVPSVKQLLGKNLVDNWAIDVWCFQDKCFVMPDFTKYSLSQRGQISYYTQATSGRDFLQRDEVPLCMSYLTKHWQIIIFNIMWSNKATNNSSF